MTPEQVFRKFLASFFGFSGFSPTNMETLVRDTSVTVALKIICQFRLTLESSIQGIDENRQASNRDGLVKICHKLASSAELVGFYELGQQSRSIMEGLKTRGAELDSTIQLVRDLADQIHDLLDRNCPELKSFV